MLVRTINIAIFLLSFSASVWAGESWPEFRGPLGQGHADARGLALVWSETENIAWKAPVPGRGWSSPVIGGDQIWMTTAVEEGRSLRAVCLDRRSGRLVYNVEVFRPASPPPINAKNSYASPTPVLDGERLYVHFGTFGTACLDTASGDVLWRNQTLQLDHKEGPGSSPVLAGDLLILNCDGMDVQFVAALNKHSGEVVWKTDRTGLQHPDPDRLKAYATPLVIEVDGQRQVVSPGAEQVVAYALEDGRELWKVRYPGFSTVPRPVFGNGLVYVCTGYMKPELWAIRPDGQGDVTETHVAWKATRQAPANPSPLLIGDELYMVSDQGIATCLDAQTGEEHWKQRLGGNFSASPLYADGRIYFSSEEGQTTVLAPGTEVQELAVNQLEGSILASLAVAGQAIFLRTDTHLYRIEQPVRRAAARMVE